MLNDFAEPIQTNNQNNDLYIVISTFSFLSFVGLYFILGVTS